MNWPRPSAELYPGDILTNPDYPRIINAKHFDRLVAMLEQGKVVYGGQHDRDSLKIAPTILDSPRLDSDLMKTEIFGPLLPILNFEAMEDAFGLDPPSAQTFGVVRIFGGSGRAGAGDAGNGLRRRLHQ